MLELISPHEAALDKVVEQRHATLFPTQFTSEGAPTMLSLEAPFDFTATNWGIQVRERNEFESFDKEQVKNQEVHITKTSEIEHHPKDVKADADTLK
jgi:hypothetical protein